MGGYEDNTMTSSYKGMGRLCNKNIIRTIMIFVAVALNVKYVFVDFGIDAEFQITMSYRLAEGDSMFKEMWEPHQMSAFLCSFFEKIYLELFQTTTGIVLYLQVVGVLLDAAIALGIYRVVSRYLNCKGVAFGMAWVFMIVSPKDVPLAEYANMQIWFSMLLCLTMFIYFKTTQKRWIILAAFCLCGVVLAYPSCLVLLPGVIYLLCYCKDRKGMLILVSVCFVCAILYLGIIFCQMPVGDFVLYLEKILAIETAHDTGIWAKSVNYLKQFSEIAFVVVAAYGCSFGLIRLWYVKKRKLWCKAEAAVLIDKTFYSILLLISIYTVFCWQRYVRYSYSLVFLAIIIIGARYSRRLSGDKFYFYLCGTVISLLQFLATIFLTNLELIASVPYLLIAVIVAFLPISEVMSVRKEVAGHGRAMAVILCVSGFFLVFRNIYIIRPMNGDVSTIMKIAGIVKEGPAKGIISEYMGPFMQNETIKEWEQYIKDGDSVYLIGGSLDTLAYMYTDTVVAAPSLISTPGYNENILTYWEVNPDKYPDVIVASCWYGTTNDMLTEESWIMTWIEEEYRPAYIVDGKYWRYYFRE